MSIIGFLTEIYLRKVKGLSLPRDIIKYAVKKNAYKTAIVDGERELTYAELYRRSKKLAGALLKLKVNKGDKLAVLLYNCPEYFEIRIAAYLTGIVLVPIIWDMDIEDIIFILNDCGVKCLIYHSEILGGNIERIKKETRVESFIEIASGAPSEHPRNDTGLPSLRGGAKGADEAIYYEKLVTQGALAEPRVKIKPGDLASINFSSGTTGRPKGVMLLQKSWVNSFYAYLLNVSSKNCHDFIFLHIFSFATAGSTIFLLSVFAGFKNVLMRKFNAREAVSLILAHKITYMAISPGLLCDILEHCRIERIKLTLRNIILITEGVPQELFKEALKFFGPIIKGGLGMVELLSPLFVLNPEDYLKNGCIQADKLLSVGKPVFGVKLMMVDEEEKQLPPGKIGQIAIRSSTSSQGYWNMPELSSKHFKGGWFYSNDYGYVGDGGYLHMLGRREDMIRKDKNNIIFSGQVENIFYKHPAVLQACVFLSSADTCTAFISLRNDSRDISGEEFISFFEERMKKRRIIDRVIVLPHIPKNASGKIDRKSIRKIFLKERN